VAAPPIVGEVLRSGGEPLDDATRASFGPRFGHDFGGVRVHTDARAAASADAVGALAYTVGSDIVFSSGAYAPHSGAGRRLLAHELAHTVQQGRGGGAAPDDAAESHADAAASAFDSGGGTVDVGGASAPGIAREKKPAASGTTDDVILGYLPGMKLRLDELRAAAPPSKGPKEEANRTFSVVLVLAADGKTPVGTFEGAFLKKGDVHAEQVALQKADPVIQPGMTVLVFTDQLACEGQCLPFLKAYPKTKGVNQHVYTFGTYKDPSGPEPKVMGSPKTAIGEKTPAGELQYHEDTELSIDGRPKGTPTTTETVAEPAKPPPMPGSGGGGGPSTVSSAGPITTMAPPTVVEQPEAKSPSEIEFKKAKSEEAKNAKKGAALVEGGLLVLQLAQYIGDVMLDDTVKAAVQRQVWSILDQRPSRPKELKADGDLIVVMIAVTKGPEGVVTRRLDGVVSYTGKTPNEALAKFKLQGMNYTINPTVSEYHYDYVWVDPVETGAGLGASSFDPASVMKPGLTPTQYGDLIKDALDSHKQPPEDGLAMLNRLSMRDMLDTLVYLFKVLSSGDWSALADAAKGKSWWDRPFAAIYAVLLYHKNKSSWTADDIVFAKKAAARLGEGDRKLIEGFLKLD
jgi:hypothetical protein